jgi:predicted transposase YbfD/YdcC
MPCTVKKTFEVAHEVGCTLIAQLKAHQPTLLQTVTDLCQAAEPAEAVATKDRHRGRQEIRLYEVFPLPPDSLDPEWQGLVGAVVRVTRERMDFSAKTGLWKPSADQTAYYLCSHVLTVSQCAEAIRGHWRIENTSHYVRDTTFAEDASRTRKNPGILARLRSFASNILHFNEASNLKDARYRIAIAGFDALARLRFS